ncbi:penicillin acylase family protein [Phenylobacterium sp.]|jgi:penicillin amidase|uniref:penicillin acylase family protein n=1 Tax=Phenylobacterium sp. TaxID=1871053 RepID=UPI002E318CF6|nr:penicillin acylase family protein [Phenylobacterium sp.]HEX2562002.1 penicillin acylase family protein [Phenylobacterium sp.]
MRALFPLVASAVLALASPSAGAEPARETRTLAGLAAPAEIRIDRWGISHIYAGSVRDAFFLQGYNVARDRLWQIDTWRKRGLGLLARDYGPAFAEKDRAARLFLYRGDMDAEWAAYGPHAKGYAEAFVAGINAYVAEVDEGRRPLPEAFRLAGTRPNRWSPEDVVRIRSHALSRNAASEVGRARIACRAGGVGAARLFRLLEPEWRTKVPEGLDPCDIPETVLEDYQLATGGFRLPAGVGAQAGLDAPSPDAVGSNNWTVSGGRTETGRPILANDPHREHGVPSLRYIVHLEAPGFSVIGAGEPALPGISIGHNGTIAFGLTIFNADQEDLYVYETDPADPDRYRFGEGWEPMRMVREAIEVKGEPPRIVELRFTRHGPVVFRDPKSRRAFAVRSVWSEPGTGAYFGSVDYMTAKDWAGFSSALRRWGAPSENQMYADTSGHIGWVAAGKVPRRPAWDGLMPVPGDGRYEWGGFLSAEELPSSYDPPQGWLGSANQMNLPPGFPLAERKVGFEWSNRARMDRIAKVLGEDDKVSVADSMALQTDPYNTIADRLIPLLPARAGRRDREANAALALLRSWDRRAAADSAGAALFETWIMKHLGPAAVNRAAPRPVREMLGGGDLAAAVNLLERSPTLRTPIILPSLAGAWREVEGRLGPDPEKWRWGDLHQAKFEHPLSPLLPVAERERLAVGPTPMSGTAHSPLAATWRPSDFRVVSGASFRMVLDVGAWDNSRVVNTPGQSEDPASPHFRDLFPLWARGEYVPLAYSRPAVEAVTERVIALTPGR